MRRWPRIVALSILGALLACVVVAVVAPLLWPVASLTDTVEPMTLRDKESRFAVVNGRLVHYKLWGSPKAKRTVLLLHGFGASDFSWRDVAPLLASAGSDTKVVAIDRTGFGLTERPMPPNGWAWQKESPYSYKSQAETAYALLDQLSVERAAIVGHSQGAAVAVTMAELSPQRVTGLVLVAPALRGSGPVPAWIAPALRTPQGRRIGPALVRGIAGPNGDDIIRRSLADPANATQALLDGYRLPLRAKDWDRGLWELSIAPQPIDPSAGLAALDGIPTLVIIPAEDRIVPPKSQRDAAGAIPDAEVMEVAGANHLYHEEQAAAFTKTVRSFLGATQPR